MTGSAAPVPAVLIGLHNIPEGMAVSVPLISGGMMYVVFDKILPFLPLQAFRQVF